MIGKSLPIVIVLLVNSASCLIVRYVPPCYGACPVVLTCPAGNQATNLTWTEPGGDMYFTGTTINKYLSSYVRNKISANYTAGTYRLTIKEFWSGYVYTGIYTCTVDGTANQHMVVLMDVTKVYTRLNGDVILQCPDGDGPASWYAFRNQNKVAYSQTIYKDRVPENMWNRMGLINSNGTNSLIIGDVQLSDVGYYRCHQGRSEKRYALLVHSETVEHVDAYAYELLTLTCPAGTYPGNKPDMDRTRRCIVCHRYSCK